MKKFILAFIIVFCASQSNAFVICTGKVTFYEIANDGLIKADWGFGPRMLCRLNADSASPVTVISKETCQAWYANILTSFSTGHAIGSAHSSSTTCAQAMGTNDYGWPAEAPYSFVIVT
jgi:hypothetical protein